MYSGYDLCSPLNVFLSLAKGQVRFMFQITTVVTHVIPITDP